jgi:hypothetical protein
MLTQDAAPDARSVQPGNTSSKFRQLLRRRTRQLLRLAIAVGIGTAREWDAFSLKLEYLEFMRSLDEPDKSPIRDGVNENPDLRLGDMQIPEDLAPDVYAARRFLAREPERSRRVSRLLFANWLARSEAEDARPAKPAYKASLSALGRKYTVPIYPVGPEAPTGARVVSPPDLARWLATTNDARFLLSARDLPSVRIQEHRIYRDLVLSLAEELYRREHGSPASSEQALVGPYLESLPEGPSDEFDDATSR